MCKRTYVIVFFALLLIFTGCSSVPRIVKAGMDGDLILAASLADDPAALNERDEAGCRPLAAAARKNLGEIVKMLIKKNVYVDEMDPFGWTALTHAANAGSYESAWYLLKAGADINFKDKYNRTPVFMAAFRGYPKVVKLLAENGAGLDDVSTDGSTALLESVKKGSLPAVNTLIKSGANVNFLDKKNEAVIIAAGLGRHYDILEALLKAGANPDARIFTQMDPDVRAYFGSETLLSRAAFINDIKLAKLMLKYKADTETRTDAADSRTPLMIAARKSAYDMVKLLLANGADPKSGDCGAATLPFRFAFDNETPDKKKIMALLQPFSNGSQCAEYMQPKYNAERARVFEIFKKRQAAVKSSYLGSGRIELDEMYDKNWKKKIRMMQFNEFYELYKKGKI